MSMQKEIAHRLLDELFELRDSRQSSIQLVEARRHFLLAKRELLLGALSLVDHALEPSGPASDGSSALSAKKIPVED